MYVHVAGLLKWYMKVKVSGAEESKKVKAKVFINIHVLMLTSLKKISDIASYLSYHIRTHMNSNPCQFYN